MIDPQKIDFNQLPKKFCDGAIGTFGKEIFSFALTSGNTLESFATTPQIMKSISVWLEKQIENYETKFGVIDMTQPHIESPLHITDIKRPDANN